MVKTNGNGRKIVLDLCGGTGAWSKPYKEAGYDVRNITLPKYDVREYVPPKNVYGILVAPPCTMFSLTRTKAKKPRDLKEGMEVVRACLNIIWSFMEVQQDTRHKKLPLKFWALENPNGMLKYFLGKPAFVFDPWEFGDGYQKKTHIWGWFNEPKKNVIERPKGDLALYKSLTPSKRIKFDRLHTKDIAPEFYGKLTRTERRAITPKGFAEAFFKANR